jgi:succinyl-CoA synthetase alpha subunit
VAILIDERTRVVVQGITGLSGRFRSALMVEAGTVICAGVTPGRRGESVNGIPVYNTVREAVEHHPEINASFILVPAALAKGAVFEALDAGIPTVLFNAERVPHHDTMEVIARARMCGSLVIGPNAPGMMTPEKANLGGLGGRIDMMRAAYKPGSIGIISRSGGNTMTLAYYLVKAGFGTSTAIGVGGDGFVGTTWATLLEHFERDPETEAVVAYGEIGGSHEEEAADLLARGGFTKPLIAYIGGRFAVEGMRFGHAGAVISAGRGSADDKRERLRAAGAIVVDHFDDVAPAVAKALGRR